MNLRFQILLWTALLGGCAHRTTPGTKSPDSSATGKLPTTQPILYHRTGGIAATDDRVIIWPDGFVEVTGKLLGEGLSRLEKDRQDRLVSLFSGWNRLKDQYLAAGVADAYTITINYGDKAIEASDLAPDLPSQFRQIFTEIEAIASQAESKPTAP